MVAINRVFGVLALAACSSSSHVTVDAAAVAETNCFDGVDNNGDGKADCADPSCAAVAVCVDAVPAGWTGFASIYDGVASGAPSCAAPFAMGAAPGNDGLTADPATCTACTCGVASNNICPAGGGAATVPPFAWADLGVACTSSATTAAVGCTGTQVCQPRAAAHFESGLCVEQTGEVVCPAGSAFTARHVFYASVDDGRACAACTCGAAVGGACASGGGAASGSAAGAIPTTFCCVP
jgi:hypothetical protein